jgi:hypothetical protein
MNKGSLNALAQGLIRGGNDLNSSKNSPYVTSSPGYCLMEPQGKRSHVKTPHYSSRSLRAEFRRIATSSGMRCHSA